MSKRCEFEDDCSTPMWCRGRETCGRADEALSEQRRESRRVLDQLSVGERFMLMFGVGVLKRDPLRVEWKGRDGDGGV